MQRCEQCGRHYGCPSFSSYPHPSLPTLTLLFLPFLPFLPILPFLGHSSLHHRIALHTSTTLPLKPHHPCPTNLSLSTYPPYNSLLPHPHSPLIIPNLTFLYLHSSPLHPYHSYSTCSITFLPPFPYVYMSYSHMHTVHLYAPSPTHITC